MLLSNAQHVPADVCRTLARRVWPGVELRYCVEDIRQPREWKIGRAEHTLIVHMGGTTRRLESSIEGKGRFHGTPAPGDIWLIPADQQYSSFAQGRSISYAELLISPEVNIPLPQGRSSPLGMLAPRMGHRDDFLYHSVAQLVRLVGCDDDLAGMLATSQQQLLLAYLYREYQPLTVPSSYGNRHGPVLSPTFVSRLDSHIRDNIDQPMSLSRLAEIAEQSVHHFLIAFNRAFGTTPARYILAQRLALARSLLLGSNRDIAEIASACGFSSHSHLSTTFRRETGMSPRQFRDGVRTRSSLNG